MKPEFRTRREPAAARRRAAIQVARRYRASPAHVFHAWLDPDVAGHWLFATASRPMARVDIDARVAGSFRFVEQRNGETVEHRGEYLEIVPHRRLAFTLASADHPQVVSRVCVDITELDRGCAVTLRHEDLPSRDAKRARARWTGILYGLGATLDARH
ncbi:MAG TPA: SRPBCC family protein [Casimicrobiaceae bacterium]